MEKEGDEHRRTSGDGGGMKVYSQVDMEVRKEADEDDDDDDDADEASETFPVS